MSKSSTQYAPVPKEVVKDGALLCFGLLVTALSLVALLTKPIDSALGFVGLFFGVLTTVCGVIVLALDLIDYSKSTSKVSDRA